MDAGKTTTTSASTTSASTAARSTTSSATTTQSTTPSSEREQSSPSSPPEPTESVSLSRDRPDDDFDPDAMKNLSRSLRAEASADRQTLLDGHDDQPIETPAEPFDFETSDEFRERFAEAGRVLDENVGPQYGVARSQWGAAEAARLMRYRPAEEVAQAIDSLPAETSGGVAARLVTSNDLNSIARTDEERATGVTSVDRPTADGSLDRLLVISNPLDENGHVTGEPARNPAEVGQGTTGDDTLRLVRASDRPPTGTGALIQKSIDGEAVPFAGTPSAYALELAFKDADTPGLENPQLTSPHGTTQPLGAELDLDFVGGNNRLTIDQPINTSGMFAQYQTFIGGSPNGIDTYDFDETVHAHTLPVSVSYNGEPLFDLPGTGGLGVDEFHIEQAEGGQSRFRIPYTRYQELAEDSSAVAEGRIFYQDGYLYVRP